MRMQNKFRSPETEVPTGSPIPTEAELEAQRLEESSKKIEPPAAPPIDKAYLDRLEQSVRGMQEENRRLQQLVESQTRLPAPTAPDPEKEKAEYYENPAAWTSKKIEDALNRTIAPINKFIGEFQGQSQLDNLINETKNDIRFKGQWDSDIEQAVRQQLSAIPANQINKATVAYAAVNAIGLKAMGTFGNSTPTPTPVPNNSPPNVRPSNPPAPRPTGSQAEPVVTENERTMARANGQTVKEYIFYRDVPADKMMTAKWDKEKQTGTY